jgi:hypothetical protein
LSKRGVEIAIVTCFSELVEGVQRYGLAIEGAGRGVFPTVDAAMAALAVPKVTRNT